MLYFWISAKITLILNDLTYSSQFVGLAVLKVLEKVTSRLVLFEGQLKALRLT